MFKSNAVEEVFARSELVREGSGGDEEARKWAALERLPTYARARRGIFWNGLGESKEVRVEKLEADEREILLNRLLSAVDYDPQLLFDRIRSRFLAVDLEFPKIEVRFENLKVESYVHLGSRALPTIPNFIKDLSEVVLRMLHMHPGQRKKLVILDDISGIIRPSRLTLLLGPPSSGKTSLMLALAGRLSPGLQMSGKITYNGQDLREFVPQRTSAYVSQQDFHTAEVTVRETLSFAARCQGVGIKHEMLKELVRREKQSRLKPEEDLDIFLKAVSMADKDTSLLVDYLLKILGLELCADTPIGNEMIKGISGGQMKRLTTGEILAGQSQVLFMDEISNGLDCSTTFQIIKYLKHATCTLDGTTVISLLQPAPETYELFDDVILLSDGQIVYQGPCDSVLDFFSSMGFTCPERKNVADFLQEVISKNDQEQYWSDRNRAYQYVSVENFAKAFSLSRVGHNLFQELLTPFNRRNNHPAALFTSSYGVRKWELMKIGYSWQRLLMKRNSFIHAFRFVQLLFLAFLTMMVFIRTKMHHNTVDDGALYVGALYFSMITILFNGFTESAILLFKLPVIYRHRDMHFYPCWVYSIPSWLLSIPNSIIESGIWAVVTYFMIGFDPNISRFFKYFLMLFLLHQMSSGLFRVVGSFGRNLVVSNTIGAMIMLVVMALGGYIITKDSIPLGWVWGFWLSPLMYCQNAVSVNEFLGHSWDKPFENMRLGEAVLKSKSLFTDSRWYWIGVWAMVAYIIFFNVIFTVFLSCLQPLGKRQAIISNDEFLEKERMRRGESMVIQLSEFLQHLDSLNGKSPKLKGMILPFQPLSMSFSNINYYVDVPLEMVQQGILEDRLQLLADVTGAFRPGILTALVGSSGAGKTTLMDVLAGRKTGGHVEGSIFISGHPKKQETFARVSGYCEQTDVHSPCLTVLESLLFSAWLRLSSEVDLETQVAFVNEIMELVELTSLRGALVGLPAVDGLSIEQRKRLTIAVELVANPSIIFMDEPTTGLDARSAAIVMRTVRNVGNTGRTIVCTIHQPSRDIFESFDELFFMKHGGKVIYAGPIGRSSCKLIDYFEAVEGVQKIRPGYNAAAWLLDVTSSAEETRLNVDFAELYQTSRLFQDNKELVDRLSKPPVNSKEISFPTKYSRSFFDQFLTCFWKQNLSYWRNPHYTAVRFFYTVIISLMLGSISWKLGTKKESQQDIFNALGSQYLAVLFLGIPNGVAVQPIVAIERFVSYRERAAGLYSALPFAFAQVAIEIPYVFVQTTIYAVLFYSMASFEWTYMKFIWYMFFIYFTVLYFTLFGMMTAAITPNYGIAALIAAPIYMVWNLFSGFMIPYQRIPVWWRWYYWLNPIAWSIYGLLTSQYGDDYTLVKLTDEVHKVSIRQLLQDGLGYKYENLGIAGIMVSSFCLLFAVIFAYAIKSFNFLNR